MLHCTSGWQTYGLGFRLGKNSPHIHPDVVTKSIFWFVNDTMTRYVHISFKVGVTHLRPDFGRG